jgi:hypothetical protein
MELKIEKFNPTKAEVMQLAEQYSHIEIKDVNDKVGYDFADTARKELKKVRVSIQKTGKELRADALSFQKKVIELEKELVGIIEPIEKDIADKQQAIDEEKEKIKRAKLLPGRIEKLKSIQVVVADDFLLLLDDQKFEEFYNQKNTEFLAEEKRKLDEERQKIEDDKRRIEAEKTRQAELEQARQEAREAERRQAELEKQRLIDEQKRKEKEAEEAREAERARLKDEQEKLEAQKKYQNFLKKNDYNDKDFYIQREGKKVILYKKIDEIVLS